MSKTSGVVMDLGRSPHARLRPVPLTAVEFADDVWAPRRATIREETIREQLVQCENTGRIDNFRRASGRSEIAEHQGLVFNDSDVYKTLEAAGYALMEGVSPELEKLIEDVIDEIAAAQQPDGYLNTAFMFEQASARYTNLTQELGRCWCVPSIIKNANY